MLEVIMQRWQWTRRGFILAGALAAMIIMGPATPAAEPAGDYSRPKTVLELTEDFYRTLRSEGTRTYATTGSSDEYLRQIAVSSRFMVETNLQLLQQQKRIIQLLEASQQKPATKK
jgi:hypothetical protein